MWSAQDIPTLTDDDKKVVGLLELQMNDWTRRGFESALIHLVYAHRIASIDPAMAIFRGITAEEEAASALIRSLQLRKYPRSKELKEKCHLHKAAVLPFILSVIRHSSHLEFAGVEDMKLGISHNEPKPRLKLALILSGKKADTVAHPEPPLNFSISEGDEQQPPDYRRYLIQILDGGAHSDIRAYFEKKANQRNLLLYSAPQGLRRPEQDVDEYLKAQKGTVILLLKAALLIWPYRDIQPFVVSCVDAYLLAVQRINHNAQVNEA